MAIVQGISHTYMQSGLTEINLNLIVEASEVVDIYNLIGKRIHLHEIVMTEEFPYMGMPTSLIINNHNFSELKSFSNKLKEPEIIKPREVKNSIEQLQVE